MTDQMIRWCNYCGRTSPAPTLSIGDAHIHGAPNDCGERWLEVLSGKRRRPEWSTDEIQATAALSPSF